MNQQTTEVQVFQVDTIDMQLMEQSELASCHLIRSGDDAALIDVVTSVGEDLLLSHLKQAQVDKEHIRYIIVTHIHLDHAGAAGYLIKEHFPQAKLVVHKNGAKHMLDPSKLIDGATKVYGEQAMQQYYGKILPVPNQKIIALEEGSLAFGKTQLDFIDTPGHARHHFCIWEKTTRSMFTGDTFGLAYPKNSNINGEHFVFPATTPSAFEPEALKESIRKIHKHRPETAYLTHFGAVQSPQRYTQGLLRRVDDYVTIGKEEKTFEKIHAALDKYLRRELKDHGGLLENASLAYDAKLNAMGIAHWYSRYGS